jgi:hypothetical protein
MDNAMQVVHLQSRRSLTNAGGFPACARTNSSRRVPTKVFIHSLDTLARQALYGKYLAQRLYVWRIGEEQSHARTTRAV